MTIKHKPAGLAPEERQSIARLLNGRPGMIGDIAEARDMWSSLAKQTLEKRLSAVTDILSTESLKVIASGEVDLAAECKDIAAQLKAG